MQLNSQPELGIGDSSVPSFTDDEEELEDPAFPDTITTSAQTSDQSAPLPFTHSVSPDGVYHPMGALIKILSQKTIQFLRQSVLLSWTFQNQVLQERRTSKQAC
jgi:hypothetical protein